MKLEPYSEYRDSGLSWLERIPAHWLAYRAKVNFREVDERSKDGNEELLSVSHMTGITPRSQKNVTMFKAASYAGHKLCRPGDIVINTMWAWMGALGESRHIGIVSPAYGVYRPHSKNSFIAGYLDYLLRTKFYISEYICQSTGIRSSRLRLYPDKFLRIPLIQPPIQEQLSIVDFLRAQDRQIAKLVRAKRRLIELLNEKKQTIIHHAVTRGLNPDIPLKPSGVDWIGDVPEHWGCFRLKALVNNIIEQTDEKATNDLYIALEHVEGWSNKLLVDNREGGFQSQVKRFRSGDVLFGKLRPYLAKVVCPQESGVCVGEFLVLRARDGESITRYLSVIFRYKKVVELINSSTCGAKMPRAEWSFIGNVRILLPQTPDERKRIVDYIESEILSIDQLIRSINNEIKLILEYRACLISDAVTGQIDVRGWQPEPDDESDDEVVATLSETDENDESLDDEEIGDV